MKRLQFLATLIYCALAGGQASGDTTYYLLVFSSQKPLINAARYSHSFATFVRVDGAGWGQLHIQSVTISWLPETLKLRPLKLNPEPGVLLDLNSTLNWTEENGTRNSLRRSLHCRILHKSRETPMSNALHPFPSAGQESAEGDGAKACPGPRPKPTIWSKTAGVSELCTLSVVAREKPRAETGKHSHAEPPNALTNRVAGPAGFNAQSSRLTPTARRPGEVATPRAFRMKEQ
jgi:hypothetical protein